MLVDELGELAYVGCPGLNKGAEVGSGTGGCICENEPGLA